MLWLNFYNAPDEQPRRHCFTAILQVRMRGLPSHSRRPQMFLAKPSGHSELLHRHGMERRSWQGTCLVLPPLTLLLRAVSFSNSCLARSRMLHSVLCLELFLPQSLLPQFTQVTGQMLAQQGRTSLAPQPPSQLLPPGTKSFLLPFFPTEAYQSHFLRPF